MWKIVHLRSWSFFAENFDDSSCAAACFVDGGSSDVETVSQSNSEDIRSSDTRDVRMLERARVSHTCISTCNNDSNNDERIDTCDDDFWSCESESNA